MTTQVGPTPSLLLRSVVAFTATAVLVGVAAGWLFTKKTPTGESATRNIICWKTSSGSGVCVTETGQLRSSGSIVAAGMTLGNISGTGANTELAFFTGQRTLSGATNTSFTAATGNISIGKMGAGKAKLDVVGTISGSSIVTGIGSASAPSLTFNGDTNTGLFQSGADALSLVTAGTQRLRVDSNGNVGIGVSAPVNKLEVNNKIVAGSSAGWIALNGGSTSYLTWKTGTTMELGTEATIAGATYSAKGVFDSNGNLGLGKTTTLAKLDVVGTISGSVLRASAAHTGNALIVTGSGAFSGSLGIGTTTPSEKLHIVSGNLRVQSGNIRIDNQNYLQFYSSDGSQSAHIRSPSDEGAGLVPLVFSVGAGETMRITNAGNVGIGTTTPSAKLSVAGTMSGRHLRVTGTGARPMMYADSRTYIQSQTNGSTALQVNGPTSGSFPTMVVSGTGDGNGGTIVIDNPASYGGLAIYESSAIRGILAYGDSGNIFTGALSNSLSLRSENALHVGGGGNNLIMTVTAANVGIGTVAPKAKLDVVGTISGSNLYVASKAGIGTASPSAPLHVVNGSDQIGVKFIGAANQSNAIFQVESTGGADNGAIFRVWDDSGNNVAMTLNAQGNQGALGLVGHANGLSQSILTVDGKSAHSGILAAVNDALGSQLRVFGPSGGDAIYINTRAATQGGLNIIGFSGQSADLLRWQDSGGNNLSIVNATGNFGIGTKGASLASKLAVSGSVVVGNNIGARAAKAQLDVVGTMSGTALRVSNGGGFVGTAACYLAGGAMGHCTTSDASSCTCVAN